MGLIIRSSMVLSVLKCLVLIIILGFSEFVSSII